MLFMILLGLSLSSPASFGQPQAAPAQQQNFAIVPPFASAHETRKDCPDLSPRIAEERERGARARRLDELPPGRLEYAVFRAIDGCAIPAVVHQYSSPDPEDGDRR